MVAGFGLRESIAAAGQPAPSAYPVHGSVKHPEIAEHTHERVRGLNPLEECVRLLRQPCHIAAQTGLPQP